MIGLLTRDLNPAKVVKRHVPLGRPEMRLVFTGNPLSLNFRHVKIIVLLLISHVHTRY